jgi:hypothetical protein
MGQLLERVSDAEQILLVTRHPDELHPQKNNALQHARDTGCMRGLVPVWAAGAHLPPDTFRQAFLGKDFEPVEAWGLQRKVLALINAHTHAALKDTGPELATAIQSAGSSASPGVLTDAQGWVTQLLSPAVRADFVPSGPALAGTESP